MKLVYTKKLVIVFVGVFMAAFPLWSQQKTVLDEKKKKGLNILMIGDSNTENGNITMGLKAILDSMYGDYGSGFCTLNPNSMGWVPDSITINCDSNWNFFDMRNDVTPAAGTYYSPNGLSISSAIAGAETVVHFSGNAIDLYYLQSPLSNQFSVMIDGKQKEIINPNIDSYQTKKAVFKNIGPGSHTMSIKVISGSVTLIGMDAKMLSANNNQRVVLHKWEMPGRLQKIF